MNLLYIYLDFTQNGKNPEGYRGHKQCELNFDTENIYTMEFGLTVVPYYCLKRTKRKESEKIERGFWGDERIYNISAIVGENGTGKTTLMHTIIRLLTALYEKDTQELPFDFACLLQDTEKHLYLVYTGDRVEIDTAFICEKVAYSEDCVPLTSLGKTKLLYFSNTISMADVEQYDRMHRNNHNNLYTDPLYDCSLSASMIRAQEASNVTSDHRSLESQLFTYFTFESYQEARYLFDRNQRNILLHMKDQGYPVPFPRELNLEIYSSVERLKKMSGAIVDWRHYSNWRRQYNNFSYRSQNRYFILTELSLNCMANFLLEVNDFLLKDDDFLLEVNNSRKYSNTEKVILSGKFTNPQSYIETMNSVFALQFISDSNLLLQNYYQTCKKYIEFLWNNADHIQRYWKFDKGRCHIILGEQIDPILQELMIRFVDLNRAVSMNDYFVIYHWGLSSGESILLHMFTKLRYLLQGNIYDEESTDFITEEFAQKAILAQRKEFITNCFEDDEEVHCDSVFLFLDEADLSLHPEWQRVFVATLAEFLPCLYQNPYYEGTDSGCRDIQIILTTHSPLMLGDFPAACVLYLKKENDGFVKVNSNDILQPFGQNLYTLLKDGFYLQNGTIGALAQKKIKSVLEDVQVIKNFESHMPINTFNTENLDEWEERLEAHRRQTIRYLSHGILRSKLEEEIAVALTKIDQRRNSDRKEQKKQELREDIARLQHQLYELESGEEVPQ